MATTGANSITLATHRSSTICRILCATDWRPTSAPTRVRNLLDLFVGEPVRVVHLTQIFPGYDNIVYRRPAVGNRIRQVTYAMEQTPLTVLGISHFLVIEKVG